MLFVTLGLALTTILLARVGLWSREHAAGFGCMSQQWVAAHNASQPSSSI